MQLSCLPLCLTHRALVQRHPLLPVGGREVALSGNVFSVKCKYTLESEPTATVAVAVAAYPPATGLLLQSPRLMRV